MNLIQFPENTLQPPRSFVYMSYTVEHSQMYVMLIYIKLTFIHT